MDIMSEIKKGRYGDGSVYHTTKNINGKPYSYWIAKYKSPLMAKPKELRGKTEKEAKRLLKQMKEDAVKNDYIEVRKQSVQEYMDNWLNTVMKGKLKEKSFDTKEAILRNNVYPYIRNIQIGSLHTDDIQDLINTLSETKNKRTGKTLSYSTIKKAYEAVNACFRLAASKGDILKNPCEGVSLPERKKKPKKKKKSDIRYFNDDEIKIIKDTCTMKYGNGKSIYRLGWGIIFLIFTGLRIGEFLALTWDDIDFKNKFVSIDKSIARVKNRDGSDDDTKYIALLQDDAKTFSSIREVQLSSSALEAAKELKKLNGHFENVACTSEGNIIHDRAFDRMFRAILVKAGIDPTGVHALRHTFASLLFRKGADVKVVSELLGHSSVQITYDTYIHIIEEQKREVISLLTVSRNA